VIRRLGGRDFRGGGVAVVVGRHDLHAGFLKAVLDFRVEAAEERLAVARVFGGEEEFVAHIKIFQSGLAHGRGGLGADALGARGGGEQQVAHLAPRCVVANGDDGCVSDGGGVAGEVFETVGDDGVGQHDDFVAGGAQRAGEESDGLEHALGAAGFDVFAGAQVAAVDEGEAAGELSDEVGGAEGKHESAEDGDAAEGGGVAAGDVGEGDDDGGDPDAEVREAAGGLGGDGVEEGALGFAVGDGAEVVVEQLVDDARDKVDEGDDAEAGEGAEGGEGEGLQFVVDEVLDLEGEGAGAGEGFEGVGDPRGGAGEDECQAGEAGADAGELDDAPDADAAETLRGDAAGF